MRITKCIAWVVVNMLLLTPAHAVSFDCDKAATYTERLICGDAELSRLDDELNAAYKIALKDGKHAKAIRQSQKKWLGSQLSHCKDVACVREAFEKRLSWLQQPIVTELTGTLIEERGGDFSATLLPNGKVLIAGGASTGYGGAALGSAELYDPSTGRFTATGNLVYARKGHAATLLPDGKVLISGGYAEDDVTPGSTSYVSIPELYDPASGTFSQAEGSFPSYGAATMLSNGKVLFTEVGAADGDTVTAELYDPASGRTTHVQNNPTIRRETATLLQNGQVLVVAEGKVAAGTAAYLYSPETNRFSVTGSPSAKYLYHTATLLLNGKVLLAGGEVRGGVRNAAELYDPATGRFSPAGNLLSARFFHSAILLPNGKVLIAGGTNDGVKAIESFELYDPAMGKFSLVGKHWLSQDAGYYCTFTLLKNGKVLVIDGTNAEIYDPAAIDH
jgi:uncharacterized protein YecT (DUF1311 family)